MKPGQGREAVTRNRTGRILRSAGLAVAAFLVLGPSATSFAASPARRFASEKARAATPRAYSRAEERLRHVRAGMTQAELFELLQMKVLVFKDKPVGALVEGYLGLEQPESAPAGERRLLFGFREDGHEEPRAVVVIQGDVVSSIRFLEATPAEGPSWGGPLVARH